MKNALTLYLKYTLSRRYIWLIYSLCALAILGSHLSLMALKAPQSYIRIAVVDTDQSPASTAYIRALKEQALLSVFETSGQGAARDLAKNRVEAVLTIPRGFFQDLTDPEGPKLVLNYRAFDAMAPALLDLMAQDLMPQVGSARLIRATNRYLGDQWVQEALGTYWKYLEDHPTEFNANLEAVVSMKGLRSQQQERMVAAGNTVLGYAMVLVVLLVVLERSRARALPPGLGARFGVNNKAARNMALAMRLVDGLIYGAIWTCGVLTLALNLTLRAPLAISLWLMGFGILAVFSELLSWLYALGARERGGNDASGQPSYGVHLLAIGLVVLLGLVGGAFFPIDLLPKALVPWVKYTPFFQLNAMYYGVVSSAIAPLESYLYLLGCVIIAAGISFRQRAAKYFR